MRCNRLATLFYTIVFLLLLSPLPLLAQGKGTAVGIVLGEPTGFDIKTWTSGNIGLSGSVGLLTSGIFHKNFPFRKDGSFRDRVHLQIAGHFLYHFFFGGTRVFPVYVGAGLRFKIFMDESNQEENPNYEQTDRYLINRQDLISFGFRFLIGAEYLLKLPKAKFGIYLETALNVGLAPIQGGWARVDRDSDDELYLIRRDDDDGFWLPDWGVNLGFRWYFKR
jgi:hypothetical protein